MWKWLYGPLLLAKADRLGTYASALAYCFVLSLIPFLVVAFTVGTQISPGKLDLGGAYQDLLSDILPVDSYRSAPDATTGDKPGEFVRLGFTVGMKNGVFVLLAVNKDSPAGRAGLMPGDRVMQVNGKNTENMTQISAFRAVRGQLSEKTYLTLLRPIDGYPNLKNTFEVVLEPPRNLSEQIISTLKTTSHRGLATIGFILAVYTSFNLMEQIVRTLLFIFDDPRRPQGWTLAVVLKTVALLVIWMFLLFLISIVSVATPVIQKILDQFHLDSQLWTAPLLVGRDMVLLVALFGAFFLTFFLVPTKRYTMGQVRSGALVASLGWIFSSLIFAYVLPNMWRSNAVYEALGSVVVILLWALACAWSVIVGACWIVRFSPKGKN